VRAPNGDYWVWLEPAVVNRLAAMRRPERLQRHNSSTRRKTALTSAAPARASHQPTR
jgi:hypothetical protein